LQTQYDNERQFLSERGSIARYRGRGYHRLTRFDACHGLFRLYDWRLSGDGMRQFLDIGEIVVLGGNRGCRGRRFQEVVQLTHMARQLLAHDAYIVLRTERLINTHEGFARCRRRLVVGFRRGEFRD